MNKLPIRRGELVRMEGADGWTIYEPETDSLHVLNDSARAIWELCDGETSPSEMARAISELTGVDYGQADHDVEIALEMLSGLGLVTR